MIAYLLISRLDELINHEYGNFIIQQIIFLKDIEFNFEILKYVKANLNSLAKKKFSSNVIDKVNLILIPVYSTR
jgi:hypothetical protein